MSALGVLVQDEWTERYDLMDCLKKADRAWFHDAAYYRCRSIPYRDRCLRYFSCVQTIVLYACEGITLDRFTVETLHVWEGILLPTLTGRRKKKWEEWAVHTKSRLLMGRRRLHEWGLSDGCSGVRDKQMGLGHGRRTVCCPKVLF
eukprot:4837062-Pyramimonas_sp.AAC.1